MILLLLLLLLLLLSLSIINYWVALVTNMYGRVTNEEVRTRSVLKKGRYCFEHNNYSILDRLNFLSVKLGADVINNSGFIPFWSVKIWYFML